MKTELTLGEGFKLPLEAITETFGVVAKRGAGKTHFAVVMIEEMAAASLPFVVLDPLGVMWGLRASKDGSGPGIDVVIFGGRHADIPISDKSAAAVADFVVAQRRPVLLDLVDMSTDTREDFVAAFLARLYEKNSEPLHVFIDEADLFAPQRNGRAHKGMVEAMNNLVRRGRARGLGVTMITQRPAVIDKDILTQIEVLLVLRMTAPQDRDAIKAWVRVHADETSQATLLDSLAGLPRGSAWLWSPGWLERFERVQVRDRRTYDSSATPTMRAPIAPTAIAPIDIGALRADFEKLIEKEEEDDAGVEELRARVAELEGQLAEAESLRVVQVPALADEDRKLLVDLSDRAWMLADLFGWKGPLEKIRTLLAREGLEPDPTPIRAAAPRPVPALEGPPKEKPARPRATPPTAASSPGTSSKLSACKRAILTALAPHKQGRSKLQIALQAGYAVTGGGFSNSLSELRTMGLIEGTRDERRRITEAGLAALGSYARLPIGYPLVKVWAGRLPKAERSVLVVLSDVYPKTLTKTEIAKRCGYEPTGGGFNNALSELRGLELILGRNEMVASEALFT